MGAGTAAIGFLCNDKSHEKEDVKEEIRALPPFYERLIDEFYTDYYNFVNPSLPNDRVDVFMKYLTDAAIGTGGEVLTVKALGYSQKLAMHWAPHSFGFLGKWPHLQLTIWNAGVKGSGMNIRIPIPLW